MRNGWMLFVAAALGIAAPAQGAIVSVVSSGGNEVDASVSGPGLLAVDVGVLTYDPIVLSVELEDGDLSSPLAFNSVVSNLTGLEIWKYALSLTDATWDFIGTIDPAPFGAVTSVSPPQGPVSPGVATAAITFANESDGFTLGDPFDLGDDDWGIGVGDVSNGNSALVVGSTFTLTLQARPVPEPASIALVAVGGLALLRTIRRRQAVR